MRCSPMGCIALRCLRRSTEVLWWAVCAQSLIFCQFRRMELRNLQPLAVKDVALNKGLLSERMRVIREEVIPYQWKALNDQVPGAEPSHAIENLQIAAGEKEGVHHGFIFQDSDVAKWLEAVGYRLATHPDPELENRR